MYESGLMHFQGLAFEILYQEENCRHIGILAGLHVRAPRLNFISLPFPSQDNLLTMANSTIVASVLRLRFLLPAILNQYAPLQRFGKEPIPVIIFRRHDMPFSNSL
jgi:hypothetical protein